LLVVVFEVVGFVVGVAGVVVVVVVVVDGEGLDLFYLE
jgi:hypothetical protein